MDRLIQQAVLQILTPIFDPGFSESSFGFRPKRSAQDAAKQVQRYIRSGYRQCIDMDLSKVFDRLTPAESRVFEGVIAGKASRAIAAEIGIWTKTVEAHCARINAKSRATDVAQLIRMWKAWRDL